MVSSLLYYANWHQIIANHSYFNLMGNPSLLQHTWSLGVEEQFYIVWPLLLVPGLVLIGRKRLPMIVIAGIAASAALMWILYNPSDPSRVYYGTDTRAFLLLMGILLALVWPRIERLGRAHCRCSSCSASRRSSAPSSSSCRCRTSTRRSTRAATSRPRSASPS